MSAVIQQAVAQIVGRTWSEYQLNLFGDAATGKGNRIVRAVAGSGKTTTGVEMVKRMRGAHIFLAFNKAIATELTQRGVNGRTFHSLCYSIVTKARNIREVVTDKTFKIMDAKLKGLDVEMYGSFIARLVGLAKNSGVGCLVPDLDNVWMDLCDHHDLEPDSELADIGRGIELAREVFDLGHSSSYLDFDDLLYYAVKDGLVLPKFDNVLVDEGQDTNAIQRAIIRKLMKDTSRLFVIGDEGQAIYGFRGADSDSMDLLKKEFNCVDMPLTVTYRCPQAVVKHAQQWVSHIEAAPGAPDGEVVDCGTDWKVEMFAANDMIVCRTTAPVIAMAYKLLKARIPARVMGREIGAGLKNLIKKMNTRSIEQLEVKLEAWAEREQEKARAKKQDGKVEAIGDKLEAVKCLIEGLPEDRRTISELFAVIDNLFGDKSNAVVLCTIHKSKGLEADRVFWLNSSMCPAPWARQEWQVQQEKNLCYVATTRAKKSLFLIEEKRD
jgi:DNA helicase-2/ATP-dependent DNA helicase PcrA